MSYPPAGAPLPRGFALGSLIAGLAGLLLLVVFYTSMAGVVLFIGAAVAGVLAVILGIIGLKQRQPKGFAVTGLVIGAVVAVLCAAIFVFALLFLGAFAAG